ncbi:MAG: phosphoglycerate dehydrogenase [Nitrospinae bacterium]|nr:phosphoglycerate dehydrogenase [Nitrospinota bacterium]
MRILVCDPISPGGVERLCKEPGFDVDLRCTLSAEDLQACISDYDGLVVRSRTKVGAETLARAERLKVIGRAGIGVDNIDVVAATSAGIIVMNTPEGSANTAAEHTLSMLLALARNLAQADASVKRGEWASERYVGVEVYGKVLGIIGLGRIGTLVAKKAQGLGMSTIAYDPFISRGQIQSLGVDILELTEVLPRADFITIHTPKTRETTHLIGAREFALMKPGVRLVNCARGGIVEEAALYEAINSGKVAGAALDVFEHEPPGDMPLVKHPAVLCTPHLGASTEEAQERVSLAIAQQLIDYFKVGSIQNAVNVYPLAGEMLRKVEPYMNLAEKLGSFIVQMVEGGLREVAVRYSGEAAALEVKPVSAALLKGLLQKSLSERVNLVNAPHLARERGVKVSETTSSEVEDYTSLISVELKTDKGKAQVAGTLFGKNEPRIVRVDEYRIEAVPSGYMLVFSNQDTPGVIGRIGTILGSNQINIAGMQLGRVAPHGMAVAVVNVDSTIPQPVLDQIRALPNILDAKLVEL